MATLHTRKQRLDPVPRRITQVVGERGGTCAGCCPEPPAHWLVAAAALRAGESLGNAAALLVAAGWSLHAEVYGLHANWLISCPVRDCHM